MTKRISRAERVEQNREEVLAAARRVFLARGYTGASLDAIAEEAGFSKGIVYSQFDSKADLFMALLERRIDERAAENEAIARRTRGFEGLRALLRAGRRHEEAEMAWGLLLHEFRVQAARDPALNRRYVAAHARATERLAALLARLYQDEGMTPPAPPRALAAIVMAVGTGLQLERAADPRAYPEAAVQGAFARMLGFAER